MGARNQALDLVQACLDFGSVGPGNNPLVYILTNDPRDPGVKAKSTAYLFALRTILSTDIAGDDWQILQTLLEIPFPISTLVKVFDIDMDRIMSRIPTPKL